MSTVMGGAQSNIASLASKSRLPNERWRIGRAVTPFRRRAKAQLSKTQCRVGSSKMTDNSHRAREDASGQKATTVCYVS